MVLYCHSLSSATNPSFPGVGITQLRRQPGAEINGDLGNKRLTKTCDDTFNQRRQPNPTLKPSSYTPLLRACSRERCLEGGFQVHAHLIKRGLDSDLSLQTSLLNMYTECRSLESARRVFDTGEVKTSLISWNWIITAYSQSGLVKETLLMFNELLSYGIQPDQFTLSVVIDASEQQNEQSLGRQLHSLSTKLGYSSTEEFVANSLIHMYASFGTIIDSVRVFDAISDTRNPVSWNSMIARLVENGFNEDALAVYKRMQCSGIHTTPLTSSSLLKACASLEAISEGHQVHGQIIIRGFLPNTILETALVDLYMKCRELESGRQAFAEMEERNIVTWNSLIRGYSQMGHQEEALDLLQMMREENAIPDNFTFTNLLAGAALWDYATEEFRSVHAYIFKVGLETDHFVGTALITMYSTMKSIEDARLVFDDMGWTDCGVWSSMISAYVKNEQGEEALKLFCSMMHLGIIPNQLTYSSLFMVCGDLSVLETGKQIHAYGLKSTETFDVVVESSLLTMYSNCGCISEVWRVFSLMETLGVISYNSMISALAKHGLPKEAAELFGRMELVGLRPDGITVLNLLSAYNHAGLIDEGLVLFNSMEDNYGIEPRYKHYACIVDMLARAGEIEEAIRFARKMPFEPKPSLLRIMLGACGKHQNISLGRQIAELLLKLEPYEATNYILLANVYARSGRWTEAEQVRHLMEERGVEKEVAVSWIEINRRIHIFKVEDRSNPLSEKTFEKVRELIKEIKEAGYMPDISYTVHNIEEGRREESLFYHSEKLAFSYGVISTAPKVTIRIMKNLRVCGDCHSAFKYFSLITGREIILRDNYRFHHFRDGACSCDDYW